MSRLFGTDGVRGVANESLTAELALDLAVAAAHVLGESAHANGRRLKAVVGRDPRASGEFLEAAVVSGLASAGVDVHLLGVLPTPAVAYLTVASEADFGVVISASHNPMPDNGIKFFAADGGKLDDGLEGAIEARLGADWQRPVGAAVGRVSRDADALDRYVDFLRRAVPEPLAGLRLVLDCAEGAASVAAPRVFRALGADVVAIHSSPDGLNINEACGSTHVDPLRASVVAEYADAGFAFDGDADRCLASDASGRLVDGDQLLAILALAMRERGELSADTVVTTVMSNLGFVRAMQAEGIRVLQTSVGDRYVLEAMQKGAFTLGGEQSGHIIVGNHATTGDGVLAALRVAARLATTGRPLAELAAVMTRLPQVLVNVTGDPAREPGQSGVADAAADPGFVEALARAEAELGESGRVLVRPSGTEPVVRVMVEAVTEHQAQRIADELATAVRAALTS
ncbi:MAG TPA: phosphoglucosamine mutase [Nocardioidaceae bacterium]|nr:phosphoglucosamine mutase [Nocardioidaceae bacterium]